MATTITEVAGIARNLLRDFGVYFEQNYAGSLHSILRLPHPLVDADSLVVIDNDSETATTEAVLHARAGLLKLNDPADHPSGVTVQGLHYEWFLDEDLVLHAQFVRSEHFHNRPGVTLDDVSDAEAEVMGIGTVVSALTSLATEFATDIDVSSPEGMSIPAHQRYQQVLQLIQYWESRYTEKAMLLNVGLKRVEEFQLRRTSHLTNRLVPIYRSREADDPRRPLRVRPPISPLGPSPIDLADEYWNSVDSVSDLDGGNIDLTGGWESIGGSGA